MKQIILVFAILLCTFSVKAQQAENAKTLLDEVAKKVESYQNISLEFTHNIDNKEADLHQQTRGKVVVQGDLYHLNYMGTEQIFDGKKIYLIVPEDEEVIIQNPNDDEQEAITPSKMFTFYKSGYTYAMGELKMVKGVKIQYVILTPIDTNSDVLHVKIGVDEKTKHILNVVEVGKNNTTTTLQVTNMAIDQTLPSSLFQFNLKKYRDEKNYTISEPN
ncbi:MAG: LolA family protein [Lutibacter sp.]